MWKPVAARTNSAMKATMGELSALGIIFTKGSIIKAYLNDDGLLNLVIAPDDDNDDNIFLQISGAEFAMYHDYYDINAINRLINKATDVKTLSKVLKDANETIRNEFLDKTALIAVQELEPGAPIYQLDGSAFSKEATTDWTKYSLYEWK